MKTIKCLIVDDEPLARQGLREYVGKVPYLELTGEAENPSKAASMLSNNAIDLMFLDVQMPLITGLEFIRSIPVKPLTILTTAYPEYAVQSYELDVFDYLLKPVTLERFTKAVSRAYSRLNPIYDHAEYQAFFYLKCEGRYEKISTNEILFVEAMQNYIIVHTPGMKYISHIPMKTIEEQLNSNNFIRIHKSYLVNVRSIRFIEGNEICISTVKLPVSRHYREETFRKILGGNLIIRHA